MFEGYFYSTESTSDLCNSRSPRKVNSALGQMASTEMEYQNGLYCQFSLSLGKLLLLARGRHASHLRVLTYQK